MNKGDERAAHVWQNDKAAVDFPTISMMIYNPISEVRTK
jgi:hypothetical protein